MSDLLFISDLHLTIERPHTIKLFLKFMDEVASSTKSLYILGDFVEYWIGDDVDNDVQEHGLRAALYAIKYLAEQGTKVYFMPGNRDFLIGHALSKKYNFTLIDDPTIINIADKPVLLMHGDTLCIDDLEYQKFREMVRSDTWQSAFLSKPLNEREQIVMQLREKSKAANTTKTMDIMDVNLDFVCETMKKHDVTTLIHGHTHRPAVHDFIVENNAMKRYVLSDWDESGSYLEITDNRFEVREIS